MATSTVYTLGYEGCDIDEFITGLKKNKIRRIVDIRRTPVSRKKGFSKNMLAAELAKHDIECFYMGKELGVPSEWRKAQKAHKITRAKMFSDYTHKILPKHPKDISYLMTIVKRKGRTALLCYENDALDCHRHFLAEEMKKYEKGLKIVDISVLAKEKTLGLAKSGFRRAA
ncbi:MAG: DUF488 family protein [Bdellovibrio sp.]